MKFEESEIETIKNFLHFLYHVLVESRWLIILIILATLYRRFFVHFREKVYSVGIYLLSSDVFSLIVIMFVYEFWLKW